MRLNARFRLLGIVALLAIAAVDYLVGRMLLERDIRRELERDGRDIRAMVSATRQVYDRQLLGNSAPLTEATLNCLSPHVLARISVAFGEVSRSGIAFNNVSDRPRNPANRADAVELEAMAWFRERPEQSERLVDLGETADGRLFHYSAPIWIETPCLTCHGPRSKAPGLIAARYEEAYDYRPGELRGLLSIRLPAAPLLDEWRASWWRGFALRLGGYAVLLLLLGVLLRRQVIDRLGLLGASMARLAAGDRAARSRLNGGDEIAGLSVGFDRMADILVERELRLDACDARLRLAHVAYLSLREAVFVTDVDGRILETNPAFTAMTGYDRDEVVGRNPRLLKSGQTEATVYAGMWRDLAEQGRWTGELWNRRKTGELYIQHTEICAVGAADDPERRYVCVASDVTLQREQQSRVEHLAYHDALTNLPNRSLLMDRLAQAIARANRRESRLAVCYIDLDGFKPVNDLWGHEAGDKLLIDVAGRLLGCVRAGDTVARLGGDEFVVLIGDARDLHEVDLALRRALQAVSSPFRIGPMEAVVTASIGVTVYPDDGSEPEVLLRHADQAMYLAKQSGKNRYHLFDPENDRRFKERFQLSERVRQGLAAGEFELFYQPKVDMRQGVVVGAEALIRWHHPEMGLLEPLTFLPAIEHTEQAIELGEWVIRNALRQIETWCRAGLELPVSVNISGNHLQQPEFATTLKRLLDEHPDVPPRLLEIEILETVAMDDVPAVTRIIKECDSLGVGFALDDFGTGYSSLTYFRRLPTRLLKIDRSFVQHMLDDNDDLAIVEGVVSLSRAFQRQVIAEGVESVEHGIPLLHYGCDLAQGFGIAPPMPADELPGWIGSWRSPPEWEAMSMVRWPKEDFPLLVAELHHRRWVERVAAVVAGHADEHSLPPLDAHVCLFGRWLDREGRTRYGGSAALVEVGPAHDHLHALGAELVILARTHPEAARARLPELQAASEAVVRWLERIKDDLLFSAAHGNING